MNLPEDVQTFLERVFPPAELKEALLVLSDARIKDGTVPNARLLRCAAIASAGSLQRLKQLASLVAVNWRDVIVAGEYEVHDKVTIRVRDLSEPLQV